MSKLGFGIDANQEYSNQYEQIADAKPNVVVVMINPADPFKAAGFLVDVPYVIVRYKTTNRGEDYMSGTDTEGADGRANSRRAIEHYAPLFNAFPKGYWAYYRNEIGDWSKFGLYVDEMIAWMELLAERGLKAAVGCFSVGTPDYPIWASADMARLLAAILKYGAVLLIHEYGLNCDVMGGVSPTTHDGDWFLRYRKVWTWNNFAMKYPNLRIVLGELGLDGDYKTGSGGAWKTCGLSPEAYFKQLVVADTEIMRDNGGNRPLVLGAAIFQWSDSSHWRPFDIAQLAPMVLSRIKATRGDAPLPPPPTPPPPPPPPAPSGTRRGKVIKSSNQRVTPDMTTAPIGVVEPSMAIFKFATPAVNGYYQVVGQDFWLWTSGVQLLP